MKLFQFVFILIAALTSLDINAQSSLEPVESTVHFKDGMRPCIQVNLDPEPKTLKKAWAEYLKSNYDLKLKGIGAMSNKDVLSAETVIVNQISSKTVDFYTQIVEDHNGSEMKVFVRFGYDMYITKENYPSEYKAILEIVESFMKFYIPQYYQAEIDDTEKRVEKLTEEKADLVKDIDDKTDEIEELHVEIKERETSLAENKTQLTETEEKLKVRKEKLERIRIQLRKL